MGESIEEMNLDCELPSIYGGVRGRRGIDEARDWELFRMTDIKIPIHDESVFC